MNQVQMTRALNLPPGWRSRLIGELHTGDVPLLTPFDFQNESFLHFSIPSYQEAESPTIEKGRDILSTKLAIPQHCVLFGKLNPRVQKVWNVHTDSELRLVASTEWLPIVAVGDVDQDFVYYLMWSDWVMPLAQTLVTGSTPSRQRVNPEGFYNIEVPVPPLEEQRAIGWALSQIRDAIRVQSRSITTAQALKRAAMQTLFTRGLRGEAQKETEIGPVPESWEVGILRDCAERPEYGHTASANSEPIGPQLLRITDIQDGSVEWDRVPYCDCDSDIKMSKALKADDIVVARIGATTGKSFIIRESPEAIFASYLIRLRMDGNKVIPSFLYHYMQTEPYWRHIEYHKGGRLRGGVNIPVLESLPVPLPCLAEQHKVVAVLDAIDRKIDLHRRKRAVLEDLFAVLLHKLMTGHIRVDELDLSGIKVK